MPSRVYDATPSLPKFSIVHLLRPLCVKDTRRGFQGWGRVAYAKDDGRCGTVPIGHFTPLVRYIFSSVAHRLNPPVLQLLCDHVGRILSFRRNPREGIFALSTVPCTELAYRYAYDRMDWYQ